MHDLAIDEAYARPARRRRRILVDALGCSSLFPVQEQSWGSGHQASAVRPASRMAPCKIDLTISRVR